MIYTYSTIAPELAPYPWLNQLYICNPFNAAVMLNNRAFWIPTFPDPKLAGDSRSCRRTCSSASFIILAAGFVFVGVAQLIFSRFDGRFADKL